jgi:hypothetical protein
MGKVYFRLKAVLILLSVYQARGIDTLPDAWLNGTGHTVGYGELKV